MIKCLYILVVMEEINLKELFRYILSKFYIISLIFAVVVSIGAIYTASFKTPMYNSSTKLVLTLEPGFANEISSSDIALFNNLVKTYAEIVKSRAVMERVVANLKLDTTADSLVGRVTATPVANTHVINVTVSDADNERAKLIADEVAKEFIAEIDAIYKMKNIKVVDAAQVSGKPYNIDMKKSTIRYAVAGAVLGLITVLIMFYFDNTVKSSKVVEDRTGLVVMGVIPEVEKKK